MFFFLYIEVERFSTLIVTLQSRKGKGYWFGYSTVNYIFGVSTFQM